jgi:hypothetical protein
MRYIDTNHAGVSPVLNIELGGLVTLLNIEPEGGGGKSLLINPQFLPSDRGQIYQRKVQGTPEDVAAPWASEQRRVKIGRTVGHG